MPDLSQRRGGSRKTRKPIQARQIAGLFSVLRGGLQRLGKRNTAMLPLWPWAQITFAFQCCDLMPNAVCAADSDCGADLF